MASPLCVVAWECGDCTTTNKESVDGHYVKCYANRQRGRLLIGKLFMLLRMSYEQVLAQPSPWFTNTISSNAFSAFHRAVVPLVLVLRITYPSSARPLSSMVGQS